MAEKKIDLQGLAMAENNVNAQALEKADQNKGEEISTDDHPLEVSPKEAATEQGHSVDGNHMESNMVNLKPSQAIEAAQEPTPSQAIEVSQEPEPSEAIEATQETKLSQVIEAAQETKPSQATEASQEPEPSQIIEAAQEPEKEEKGIHGFDLNQEGSFVGFASTQAAANVLFDLNVVDGEGLENQTLAPSDLQESPREVNQSMSERLNIDLNHCHEEGDGFTVPPASPPPSSSSSVLQPSMEKHIDKNGTEEPNIHNYSVHDAAAVRIMGTNVTISPERNKGGVPETLNLPSNRRAPKLFGFSLGGMTTMVTCSPSAVNEPHLLPLFCTSSTGGLKRKEPEGGLEPYTTAEKVANSSSSTDGGKEPEGDQETYVAGTKKARSC
uniref:uncharacterized protein LOC105349885 n=1 Tax=Fragaria vesca subsp. vesca TaxID=101020 RepID=UPI0005C81CE3|nr:PREDICTED: uncharacterized protein LOC105349885 [Fragaria vesca subsp. vesca]